MPVALAALLAQTRGGGYPFADVAVAALWTLVFAVPLSVSVWALLDAARRPQWAWAMTGRRQVVWMAMIMAGVLSVIGGLLISGYYLRRVRPQVRAIEDGDLGAMG